MNKKTHEPAPLPSALAPTFNVTQQQSGGRNIFERYFSDATVNLLTATHLLASGATIGNTALSTNPVVSDWVGVQNIYLKAEYTNPSGSFKDRGSFMAIALLAATQPRFILGTVSTGNMAISTAYMINQVNHDFPEQHLSSFVVVSSATSQKKIDAIQQASGQTGTTLFMVEGDYAQFHDIVYAACAHLHQCGVPIFAQLTDDVFRITGYGTLFAEIIEQLHNTEPDYIVLPVGSGALFRVAVWAMEALQQQGVIAKIPKIVLVQETGGDPIMSAWRNRSRHMAIITPQPGLVASAIVVANSRSGQPCLDILQQGYHLGVAVSTAEILAAHQQLQAAGYPVEEASSAAVAAVKQLRDTKQISAIARVVCVLTGADVTKRTLQPAYSTSNRIIACRLEDLSDNIINHYVTS